MIREIISMILFVIIISIFIIVIFVGVSYLDYQVLEEDNFEVRFSFSTLCEILVELESGEEEWTPCTRYDSWTIDNYGVRR